MPFTRRRLLQVLGTAGVCLPLGQRFLPLYEAYASQRLGDLDVRGPGLSTFARSICRDCANHCSLTMRNVDGLPVGLRGTRWHSASRGALCVAGQSQMQALFDPDRLRSPLRRADAGEAGEPVSWEEALAPLKARLSSLVDRGNGEQLVVVDGRTPSLGTRLVESWIQSIPGASYVPLRIEYAMDRLLGSFLGGAHTGRARIDLAHSGTLLLVGFELLEVDGSPVTQMRAHGERREDPHLSDAPTVYLGPRGGPTAVKADRWIPCQPGKEWEILLGLAEAFSREHPERDYLMHEYVRWIPEASDPVEFARRYSLENVAQRQGLELDELLALRRALVEFRPSVVLGGPSLLRRRTGGAEMRAALALNLWTGGFHGQSGISWVRDPLWEIASKSGLAAPRRNNPQTLAEMLKPLLETKHSAVEVLICIEANLAHELPGQDQVSRALSHIPYVASFSTHEDETSKLAHLTLPSLCDLESWDIPSPAWGVPDAAIQVQRPAVQPVVDGRSIEDTILALAAAGVRGSDFRAVATDAEGLVKAGVQIIVKGGRGKLVDAEGERPLRAVDPAAASDALLAGEAAWLDEPAPGPMTRDERAAFTSALSSPTDLAPKQVWLVTFDAPAIQSGRILNRPMMMELSGLWHGLAWESWIEIHPEDAQQFDLVNGDRVSIRGPRAEITARTVVTSSIARGCAAMPIGLGHRALGSVAAGHGANPMDLPHTALDEETGAPVWGPIPVFIAKA